MMIRIVILMFVCLITAKRAKIKIKAGPVVLSVGINDIVGQHRITPFENYMVDLEHRTQANSQRLILVRQLEDQTQRFRWTKKDKSIRYWELKCLGFDSDSYLAILKMGTRPCMTQITLSPTEVEPGQHYAKFIARLPYPRHVLCPILVPQESTSLYDNWNHPTMYYIKFRVVDSGTESGQCGNHTFRRGLTLLMNNVEGGFKRKNGLTPTQDTNNSVNVQSTTDMDSIHTRVGVLQETGLTPFNQKFPITLYIDPKNVADTRQRFHIRVTAEDALKRRWLTISHMLRTRASQFTIQGGIIHYTGGTSCIALTSDGYLVVISKNQVSSDLDCLTRIQIKQSDSEPEGTAKFDEMIVKLQEPATVLCPIELTRDDERFDPKSENSSQYYIKVLNSGSESEMCNKTEFAPDVRLRLQNTTSKQYSKKRKEVGDGAVLIHAQQDDLGTEPLISFYSGSSVVLYTLLSDGQNDPRRYFAKIDREQVPTRLIFKKIEAKDATRVNFDSGSKMIKYQGDHSCLAKDSEGYLAILKRETAAEKTNCLRRIEISPSGIKRGTYDGMVIELPFENSVLCPYSTGEIDTDQTPTSSSKAQTPVQDRPFNIKVVDRLSGSTSCNDPNFPFELTLELRNCYVKNRHSRPRSRPETNVFNEHPEVCTANTRDILPGLNGMHAATSTTQIGTQFNEDTPIIYGNPTRRVCDRFESGAPHNVLGFQRASIGSPSPSSTSINRNPRTELAGGSGDYAPDAPAFRKSMNNIRDRPNGDQYPGSLGFPELPYESNTANKRSRTSQFYEFI